MMKGLQDGTNSKIDNCKSHDYKTLLAIIPLANFRLGNLIPRIFTLKKTCNFYPIPIFNKNEQHKTYMGTSLVNSQFIVFLTTLPCMLWQGE